MGWIEEIRESATKRIADTLLLVASLLLAAIGAFADELMPGVVELLGRYATGKTVLGLLLILLALISWVIYLHPRLKYDDRIGTFFDKRTGLHYCAKCLSKAKIKAPMKMDSDNSGWRCPSCNWFWDNPDNKKPPKPKPPEGPSGPHAWMAR